MDRLNEAQIEAVQLLKNIFPRISHDAITSKVLTSPQPDVNAIIDAILAEPSTSSRDAAGPSWADSEQPPVKKAKVEPEGGEEDSKTRVDDISRELQALLPDVDPSFLARKAAELASHPPQALNDFILSCLEDPKSLPGKPKVPAQVGLLGLEIKPVVQLSVEEIIDKFKPDPRTYFYDVTTMTSYKHEDNALEYLKHKFPRHSVTDIRRCLRKSKGHYVPALKELTSLPPTLKVKRNHRPIPDALCEESFLLELNFAEKEAEVVHIIESEKQKRLSALQEGAVFECQCCFEEVLLLDAFECEEEHMFCKDCVARGAEVQMGDNKVPITCLEQCPAKFSMGVLGKALSPVVFSAYLQKLQMEEIKSAGIEGLESCPECNFCTIIANAEERVFSCLNPNCLRQTCRLCKEKSHIPLKCDEVEKDAEAKARTKVEEALTEAMVRTCWNCQTPFFKEEGCNKMSCPKCGKHMCYICRNKVQDYNHFYGQGSTPLPGRCPLYTDVKSLHAVEVSKAAEKAMSEANVSLNIALEKPREGFNLAENYVPPVPQHQRPQNLQVRPNAHLEHQRPHRPPPNFR